MAKTYAECAGYDSTRIKVDHRLGSRAALGRASTWHTKAVAYVKADGSGYILVTRDGLLLHSFEFGPE